MWNEEKNNFLSLCAVGYNQIVFDAKSIFMSAKREQITKRDLFRLVCVQKKQRTHRERIEREEVSDCPK